MLFVILGNCRLVLESPNYTQKR